MPEVEASLEVSDDFWSLHSENWFDCVGEYDVDYIPHERLCWLLRGAPLGPCCMVWYGITLRHPDRNTKAPAHLAVLGPKSPTYFTLIIECDMREALWPAL